MNNLPNTKRKCTFIFSFFTIRMLVITTLLHTSTRKEKHYAGR